MNDIWVCTNCHSVNRLRGDRCYKCGGRQADLAAESAPAVRLGAAIVNRAVRAYRPAWPLALVASILIVAVAGMGVYLVVASLDGVTGLKTAFVGVLEGTASLRDPELLTAAQAQALVTPALVRFALLIVAVVAFGLWLSLVVSNIPALGGGTPSTTPLKALVYPLIPVLNLYKVPGMIQDALYRVEPRAGGFFMVALAWFGLVGSYFVSILASWWIGYAMVDAIRRAESREEVARAFGVAVDESVIVEVVTALMVVAGAVFLVLIMLRIERRSAARDREIRSAALGGSETA
jgi:hypothetical protein